MAGGSDRDAASGARQPVLRAFHGDSRHVLRRLPDDSVDAVVSDAPYALTAIVRRFGADNAAPAKGGVYARTGAGFMGQRWDTGETAFDPYFWMEVLRVVKPGGHIVVAGGTRTYHRLATAVEDAGFEIRDMVSWLYGSGFPKSHDVAKGIDATLLSGSARTEDIRRLAMGSAYRPSGRGRANFDHGGGSAMNGAKGVDALTAEAAKWDGWGTALKPACEPWVLARKPLAGTVASNVMAHGTGAINIDGRRIIGPGCTGLDGDPSGRWPANVVHDGSDEVVAAFPMAAGQLAAGQLAAVGPEHGARPSVNVYGDFGPRPHTPPRGDSGSAARFFYSAKAGKEDRAGSKHPTVKPVALMAWLCRLVTPPGGLVLDPFAGSGSTGVAALREGFDCILVEREADYFADIERRFGRFGVDGFRREVAA